MKGTVKKTLTAAALAAAMAATAAAPASARTASAAKTWKKAKTLRVGTTTVRLPKQGTFAKGYVKFTAPKSGTYSFEVGGLRKIPADPSAIDCGYASVEALPNARATAPASLKVTTQGGKVYALYLCTDRFAQVDGSRKKKKVDEFSYLTKRTFSLKMKKGGSAWLYFSFTGGKSSVKVKVRKR